MENIQPPQNGTTTQQQTEIKQTYQKSLFPTEVRCFSYPLNQELIDEILKLNDGLSIGQDLMNIDNPTIAKFKDFVYEISHQLSEFNERTESDEVKILPHIIGSNILCQQAREHIPLHAYEFTPLVFTFVLNTGQWPQFTYYADTRGAVQTTRQKVSQNLVGTSFGLKGQVGEVIVTPGYLQRYTETNLSDQAQVFLNILVGFTNY